MRGSPLQWDVVSRAELPVKLQRFIAAHIESVEKLEVLLLLYNSHDKWWSAQSVYQKIQSNPQSVAKRLADLKAAGFVQENKEACFQFNPKTPELADGVALLNTEYDQRRVKVIEAIFSHATEQMRRFADAFRIRKETDDR
jgi:DNA-binding IclR family transcriptional regulator